MRRRSRRSTGARARNYRDASASRGAPGSVSTRRDTTRGTLGQMEAFPKRRSERRVPYTVIRSRSSGREGRSGDELYHAPLRRNRVLSQRSTGPRLSASLVPVRRANENASGDQTRPGLCTRKKAARRAVIIATGYGGKNGFRDYKPKEICK